MSQIHSYSSLSCWVKCPRQHEALYRLRTVKRPPGPALERGIAVHDALEKAVRGTGDPPRDFTLPEGLMPRLRALGAEAEVKAAVDAQGRPCEFFDNQRAILRGAIDVRVRAPNRTQLIDWKTGKIRPDALQADVYAVFERAEVGPRPVACSFVYGDQKGHVHPEHPDMAAYDRVLRLIERVEADNDPVPKPTPLCDWCPVESCEYYTGRKV